KSLVGTSWLKMYAQVPIEMRALAMVADLPEEWAGIAGCAGWNWRAAPEGGNGHRHPSTDPVSFTFPLNQRTGRKTSRRLGVGCYRKIGSSPDLWGWQGEIGRAVVFRGSVTGA